MFRPFRWPPDHAIFELSDEGKERLDHVSWETTFVRSTNLEHLQIRRKLWPILAEEDVPATNENVPTFEVVSLGRRVLVIAIRVRGPQLPEAAIGHRFVDVVAALIDNRSLCEVGPLGREAGVIEVCSEVGDLIDLHGVDQSVPACLPAEANDPISHACGSTNARFAVGQGAAAPKWVRCKPSVMRHDVRIELHRRQS